MSDLPFIFSKGDLRDACQSETPEGFEVVQKEILKDDGWNYRFVLKHCASNRFFQFLVDYDSYEGFHWDDLRPDDLTEVYPRITTTTIYGIEQVVEDSWEEDSWD
jgi:hypothetical protein